MTIAASFSTSAPRSPAGQPTVDVFGVAWPRYKAEATLAALLVFVLGLIFTAVVDSLAIAPAILAATAAALAVGWAARAIHARAIHLT